MFCKHCGNTLNNDLRCTRCYTPHTSNYDRCKMEVKALTPAPIIELRCSIGMEGGVSTIVGYDEYHKMIKKELAHSLADEIVKHIEENSIFDEARDMHVISASIRVVEPYFKFV